jgi:peptide/nickel transport system substrate-binding protein
MTKPERAAKWLIPYFQENPRIHLHLRKKISVLTILGVLMVSAMVFSVPPTSAVAPEAAQTDIFLVGTIDLGYDLDPQFSWDSASSDINQQIWEGLFAYNLGDPHLRTVPRLAAGCGNWSADAMMFSVPLREGVTFHDGSKFNATAVKHSFDRLWNLCVYEDDQVRELYFPYGFNGTTAFNNASAGYGYVLNETVIVSEYEILFKLNYPYVVFNALLTFTASYIVHPATTTFDTYLEFGNIANDTAIGTGPYICTSHTTAEAVFEYYEDYYRGEPAIKNFKYILYATSVASAQALLAGDLDAGDWNPDFLQDFIDADHMYVGPYRTNTIITYMGYNNHLISKDYRTAMNLAINYDYITETIYNGNTKRMVSIVPEGIAYHTPCDVPTYDVVAARQYLIDNIEDFTTDTGLDATSTDDDWLAVAGSGGPVANYNYHYNLGNVVREDIGVLMKTNMAQIGIKINVIGITWGSYLNLLYNEHDTLNLYLIGWMPDYNDPSNYINPLMSNTSDGNAAQVNDPWLQGKLEAGITETDETDRKALYVEMQEYIAEDLQPWAFIAVGWSRNAHPITTRPQRNAMGYQYIFPWGWKDTNTTFTDTLLEEWCNEGGPVPTEFMPDDSPATTIPGYSMFVLLGVVAATIAAIIKKRK